MKPGYKTIPFWLALVVTLLGGVSASGLVPEAGVVPSAVALFLGVLGSAGYSAVRAWAKGGDGKPGWKTTEFWLTLVSILVGASMASGIFPAAGAVGVFLSLVATTLAALGYAVPRAFGQQMPPKG